MPDKLTDAEIKKALAQCEIQTYCSDCPYYTKIGCKKHLYQDALDLINRQEGENEKNENIIRIADKTIATLNAENESLKAEIERLQSCVKTEDEVKEIAKRAMEPLVIEITREQIDIAVKLAKAEAYKECIEKAKESIKNLEYNARTTRKTVKVEELKEQMEWVLHTVVIETLDNLLNELVGDGN